MYIETAGVSGDFARLVQTAVNDSTLCMHTFIIAGVPEQALGWFPY